MFRCSEIRNLTTDSLRCSQVDESVNVGFVPRPFSSLLHTCTLMMERIVKIFLIVDFQVVSPPPPRQRFCHPVFNHVKCCHPSLCNFLSYSLVINILISCKLHMAVRGCFKVLPSPLSLSLTHSPFIPIFPPLNIKF